MAELHQKQQLSICTSEQAVPHVPIQQAQSQIYYNRHKALGPGSNTDQLVAVLRNEKIQPFVRYPINKRDFPSAEKPWEIILASDNLLDWATQYGREVVGMDSRWKNVDICCPLTLLTATCHGCKVFPISVMISSGATAAAYEQFLDITALEIDERIGDTLWDPYVMIDHCNEEQAAVTNRKSFGRKVNPL